MTTRGPFGDHKLKKKFVNYETSFYRVKICSKALSNYIRWRRHLIAYKIIKVKAFAEELSKFIKYRDQIELAFNNLIIQ